METDQKFEIIKALLAQGYKGSIAEVIQKKEHEELQAMKAQEQAQAAQQGQNPNMPTPALAGNMPTQPQQSATERNIIQPGQYKKGGVKDKEIGDDIGFDEQHNILYNKEIQKAYEQQRGRYSPSFINDPEKYKQWKQDQEESDVRQVKSGGIKLNTRLGSDCKECGGVRNYGAGGTYGGGDVGGDPNDPNNTDDPSTPGGGNSSMYSGPSNSGTGSSNYDGGQPQWLQNAGNFFLDKIGDPILKYGAGMLGIPGGDYKGSLDRWNALDAKGGMGAVAGDMFGRMAGAQLKGAALGHIGGGIGKQVLPHLPGGSWLSNKFGWRDGGIRRYDDGGVKLSAGAEGTINCGPTGSGCRGKEARLSLKPQFNMSYNTGTKDIGGGLGLGAQSYIGGWDTRGGAPTIEAGVRGEGLVNAQTLKDYNPKTSLSLTEYIKLGYTKKGTSGAHDWSSDNAGFNVGAYGDFDLKNKQIKEAGIYGGYGALQGNIGYSPSDKMIKAGLALTIGKKKGGAREYKTGGIAKVLKGANKFISKPENDNTEILEKTHSEMLPFNFFPDLELHTMEADATYVHIPEIILTEEEHNKEEEDKENRLVQIEEENEGIDEQTLEELKVIQTNHSENRDKNRKKKIVDKVKEETKATMESFYQQYNKVDYDETSSNKVKAIQQVLIDDGYDLGAFGANKDGIDGKFGNKTKVGYLDYMQKRLKTRNPITFSPESRDEKCDENGCAQYVQAEFMREGYDVDYMDVGGDAWTMYDQIVERGQGTSKFNIYAGDEFNNVDSAREAKNKSIAAYKNNPPDKGLFQVGDVVGLIYENSVNWDNAYKGTKGNHLYGDNIKNRTYNSHVGFVSGFDDDGNPIISHNVNGRVYNDKYDNIKGGGVAWIASPQSKSSHKYDYAENTTEHDNSNQLTFFDNKNYEGVLNVDGSQHTYSEEDKDIQNNAINFVKNNTPIILDELEITINGDDGATWLQEAVIGIAMHETGGGQTEKMPQQESIRKNRVLKNLVPFSDDASLEAETYSLGITKTKLSNMGGGSKDYYGLNVNNINTDNNKVLAITIDNLSRNYALITGYAKDNPQLELTEEDIRNMTILSHNRGLLSKNSHGGGTGTNFGQRDDMTIDEQIASLRSLYTGNKKDITSTKYRHIPVDSVGEYFYNKEYPEGAETYVSKINRYIDRQILTHAQLEEEKTEEEKNLTMLTPEEGVVVQQTAKMGGYRSKNGW